jgi:hypothetical protein
MAEDHTKTMPVLGERMRLCGGLSVSISTVMAVSYEQTKHYSCHLV